MRDKLRFLNNHSPFLWEVKTDGTHYTILCEDAECFDEETDSYLTDLTAHECDKWLVKLNRLAIGFEE